jgi:hypothetical protein
MFGGGPGSKLIDWSNGQSSTFNFTTTADIVDGNFVLALVGDISAGLFKGGSAEDITTLSSQSAKGFLTACEGNGITTVNGVTELTIIPPL